MPAFGFKKKYEQKLIDGTKTTTIRAPRKDNRLQCKVGDVVKLYVGMRTKQCRLIKEVKCLSIEKIVLEADGLIIVDGKLIGLSARGDLARNDGFIQVNDMLDTFREMHGLPFEGILYSFEENKRR